MRIENSCAGAINLPLGNLNPSNCACPKLIENLLLSLAERNKDQQSRGENISAMKWGIPILLCTKKYSVQKPNHATCTHKSGNIVHMISILRKI